MRRSPRLLAAALLVVLLAGCSGGGATSSTDVGAVPVLDPATPGTALEDVVADRQVVTTADASLVVADPAGAAQQISELVEDAGGRVDQRSETAGGDDGAGDRAELVVRVPSDELTAVLRDLEDLGEAGSVSVVRDDVTGTAVDLDARISALQTSATRLEGLMAGATTTEALLDAEQALADRQQELESLQAQRAALADQVELATLGVHLSGTAADDEGPEGFLGGLATGWHTLVATLGGLVVGLGVLLPWLVVGGLVAAVVLVVLRRVRRRSVATAGGPPARLADPPGA